ncbi:MAG: hypothetical protein ABJA82_15145 [Myxococcales bacterium]
MSTTTDGVRVIRKSLVAGAGIVVFLVGLIALAHTPAGRPLLGALARGFRGGACPLGYDRAATPLAREQARQRFAATHRGLERAEGRPALGFALDQTSRADVVALMAAHGISCRPSTAIADLICEQVPDATLAAKSSTTDDQSRKRDLWFTFGASEKLIAVTALSRDVTAQQATAAFVHATGVVTRRAGPALKAAGQPRPEVLAAGTLAQLSSEFAFADYYATTRVTNMGKDYLLTEEYRSLPNPQVRPL